MYTFQVPTGESSTRFPIGPLTFVPLAYDRHPLLSNKAPVFLSTIRMPNHVEVHLKTCQFDWARQQTIDLMPKSDGLFRVRGDDVRGEAYEFQWSISICDEEDPSIRPEDGVLPMVNQLANHIDGSYFCWKKDSRQYLFFTEPLKMSSCQAQVLKVEKTPREGEVNPTMPTGVKYVSQGYLHADFIAPGQQTPIDLVDDIVSKLFTCLPPIQYQPFEEKDPRVMGCPQLGTLLKPVAEDVVKACSLVEYHMHFPAEHTVKGQLYDGEMHLVTMHEGQLHVFGFFLQLSSEGWPPLQHLLKREETASFLNKLLVELPSAYYAYEGSLTTSPYSPGVNWVVFEKPLPVSADQLAQIQETIGKCQGSPFCGDTNREVQPLDDDTGVCYIRSD